MVVRILAVALTLTAAACGTSTTGGSYSCDNSTGHTCTTVTVTGAQLNPQPCVIPSVSIESCATAGIIAHCAFPLQCAANATCTATIDFYTGSDTASGQTACPGNGGTWSTP